MNYKEVIKELNVRGCKKILITGAHRAGTTISGRIIAKEMGILYYKEENIMGGNVNMLLSFARNHPRKFVLQAPGLSDKCHLFDFDAVVFIDRTPADVLKSMERLSDQLVSTQTERTLALLGQKTSKLSLPELKLKAFKDVQMKCIKNAFILEYESWEDHPLFIPKESRKDFHLRQTVKINGN